MEAARAALRMVKPHIPMIKFRKGSPMELVRGGGAPGGMAGPSPSGAAAVTQAPRVLEEWEVPLKYRRATITEEEIEYINRGGPA
ncbi:alpha-ketoglutarate dehydrogenase component 4-like [Eriocheir sinensis]|uniref:alpha-ketoglutarate dehydrogenase component 4-like n=1 Tax=Eriocheir sinensis TaxID=95602 RepID=UPI0021CAA981|nr:alpha-ketoglutarate dehydrogenase component 4-like [Eriocheir sinensis]